MLKAKTDLVPAYKMIIRTSRENSAYLYQLLEAHEGLTAYSTLPFKAGDLNRDVELIMAPGQVSEVKSLLQDISDFVTVLKP